MNPPKPTLKLYLYIFFILVGSVIIIDFVGPGAIKRDEILTVERNREQYYNAAGNFHYSYKAVTKADKIRVEEDLAGMDWSGETIEYSVSFLFKEVNWYRLTSSATKSYYSLRIASGIVLPVLSILSMLMAYTTKRKLEVLVFVLQLLLIADLVFVMM